MLVPRQVAAAFYLLLAAARDAGHLTKGRVGPARRQPRAGALVAVVVMADDTAGIVFVLYAVISLLLMMFGLRLAAKRRDLAGFVATVRVYGAPVLPATAHLASGGPTGVCLRVRVFAGKALGVVPQSLGDM